MPKQLRLDEVLRKRRAVDRHEGSATARPARVDRPRQQLLAGPRLPDDQRARAAVRQQPGRPRQLLLEDLALAHDAGERIRGSVRGRRRARAVAVTRRHHRAAENLEVVRKREVVARPAGDQLHRRAPPGIGADDQRRQPRRHAVTLQPLDRVPLRPARRDDDGHRLGARGDGVRRSEEVDSDPEVLGKIVPESAERLGDCDYAQTRHGGTTLTRALMRDTLCRSEPVIRCQRGTFASLIWGHLVICQGPKQTQTGTRR